MKIIQFVFLFCILSIHQNITANSLYSGTFGSDSKLYTINENSSTSVLVGSMGIADVTDVSFVDSQLYAITFSELYSVNKQTGATTIIGSLGFSDMNALGTSPSGQLYAAGSREGDLIQINPHNGQVTSVGNYGGNLVSSGDLVFDSNGKLYASVKMTNDTSTDWLAQVNPNTGHASIIGNTGYADVWGLSFKDSILYGLTASGKLLKINTATGKGTPIGSTSISSGSLGADKQTEVQTQDVSGSPIIATLISIDSADNAIAEANTIVTDANSALTLVEENNTSITIRANSLITQHPEQSVAEQVSKKVTLLRGTLDVSVPAQTREYKVVTPLAEIIVAVSDVGSRAATQTQFEIQYAQDGLNGDFDINVTSGTVTVITRDGEASTLSAGQNMALNATVNRSNWVLPIDGDFIYGGRENTLSWIAYPGAAGYILEYNFPTPNFSEENPQIPEFTNKSLFFYPSQYTIWQDLVIVPLIIPDLPGSVVEARIFPIDAGGNVISTSIGSDKGTYTFK